MQFRKKILMLSLAAMLLTGCGGGSPAVEGAEPPSAPQVTIPDPQDTQSPQEPQELEPVPEVLSWDKTMQMVNADTILAKSKDGGFAILNNDGTVRASLPEYSSLTLKTPYCFIGSSGGKMDLLDVSGNVIVENVKDVHRKTQTKDDPWGILQYTAVESQEFGEKATTYFMRTDTFENIMEPTGDQTFLQFYFDGIQYLVSMPEADPMTADWFTLDGTPTTPFTNLTAAPQYVDVSILDNAPYIYRIEDKKSHYLHRESAVDGRFEIHGLALLKYSEDIYEGDSNVQFGLMDLSGKKITDIKYQWSETNNCGVLATTPDRKTDVYDANGNFCFSSDSPISFLSKTFSHFSILKTPVVNKTQLGILELEHRNSPIYDGIS